MGYKVTFGPKVLGAQIVDLTTAKLNSKIEFTEEDTLLQIFVDAAALEIENYIGQPVLERSTLDFSLDTWAASFNFPFEVTAINEVKYKDADHAEQIIAATGYDFFDNCLRFKIDKPGDFTTPLIISCKAGFINAEMPADIKRAALLIFSHADTYRENMPVKLENSAKAVLRPYKIY